mmetsp:Transcript_10673/g.17470  ORF Transcript_10673/g.17470 Transcript_10673/m.17470 type:complete len:356 (-) Transcript_10673:990-2057(-)
MSQKSNTKVVVRSLPYTLQADAFLTSIEKFSGKYEWFYYCQGKIGTNRNVCSRAYLNFKEPESVYEFHEKYNGHVFLDAKGQEFRATVEYAPYQRIPKPRRNSDPRQGTIEKDPDYIKFVEVSTAAIVPLQSAEVQLDQREAEEKLTAAAHGGVLPPRSTPLLEALKEKYAMKNQQRQIKSREEPRGAVAYVEKKKLLRSDSGGQERDKGRSRTKRTESTDESSAGKVVRKQALPPSNSTTALLPEPTLTTTSTTTPPTPTTTTTVPPISNIPQQQAKKVTAILKQPSTSGKESNNETEGTARPGSRSERRWQPLSRPKKSETTPNEPGSPSVDKPPRNLFAAAVVSAVKNKGGR